MTFLESEHYFMVSSFTYHFQDETCNEKEKWTNLFFDGVEKKVTSTNLKPI